MKAESNSMDDIQIEPRDVRQRLDRGETFLFVDVREPWEHQTAKIEGAKLIPLGQIPGSLAEFENAEDVILFCHHGMRSLDAAAWLRARGVPGARSMNAASNAGPSKSIPTCLATSFFAVMPSKARHPVHSYHAQQSDELLGLLPQC
jgi:rhodanese-related sulfurtransferase